MMPGPRTTLLVPPKALQVPSHLRVQRQIARIEPLNLLDARAGVLRNPVPSPHQRNKHHRLCPRCCNRMIGYSSD